MSDPNSPNPVNQQKCVQSQLPSDNSSTPESVMRKSKLKRLADLYSHARADMDCPLLAFTRKPRPIEHQDCKLRISSGLSSHLPKITEEQSDPTTTAATRSEDVVEPTEDILSEAHDEPIKVKEGLSPPCIQGRDDDISQDPKQEPSADFITISLQNYMHDLPWKVKILVDQVLRRQQELKGNNLKLMEENKVLNEQMQNFREYETFMIKDRRELLKNVSALKARIEDLQNRNTALTLSISNSCQSIQSPVILTQQSSSPVSTPQSQRLTMLEERVGFLENDIISVIKDVGTLSEGQESRYSQTIANFSSHISSVRNMLQDYVAGTRISEGQLYQTQNENTDTVRNENFVNSVIPSFFDLG